ncbi:hypothetical protein [Paenibacillus tyrfis]|uniref:hypothetical protein n=1 Tax=Paenibacillus tyrfis TaxID=1501230 RepID=UPI0021663A45|nr:hypothetical protein [Paenibacillus tyrfis]
MIDPMLPEELLPEDWAAQWILRQLTECMAQIRAAIPHRLLPLCQLAVGHKKKQARSPEFPGLSLFSK